MTKLIALTKGQFAIVDDQDFDWLSQFKWYAHQAGKSLYAARRERTTEARLIYMHQAIMTPPSGLEPDHIDGNGLNNQRLNLRNATHAQNIQNKKGSGVSSYRGVSWNNRARKWQVHIRPTGMKTKNLGVYVQETDAALAYNAAAILHFGEFARLNVIEAQP